MRVLTVVGRAEKLSEFEKTLNSYLSSPFRIKAVIPLRADEEAKNFLAYVDPGATEDTEEEAYDGLIEHLESGLYSVESHDSPQEAVEWVDHNYQGEAYSAYADPITSQEIFRRDILIGLMSTGEVNLIRGLLNKRSVAVLVHVSNGHGDNDSMLTPLAIMVDDEIGNNLELPFRSSFDS